MNDRFVNVWAMSSFSGLALDLSTVMYCVAPLLLLLLFEDISGKSLPKWYYKLFILFDLFCLFWITVADPEFFRQWGVKFNNQVLVYISHPKEMAISTGAVMWGKTLLFSALFLLVLVFMYWRINRLLDKERNKSWLFGTAGVINIGLCFIFLRGGVGVTTISQSSAIYSKDRLSNASAVNSLWNALYYIINDVENIYGESYKYLDETELTNSFKAQFPKDTATLDLTESNRPNVMIVLLESFTASASLALQGEMDCMPGLDALARQNLSFLKCYSSGERTEKGLVTVLAGYPAQPMSSIIVFPDKMSKLNSLGKMLGNAGYNSSFYYGGDAEFASMKSFLLVHGIDNIVDKKSFDKASLNSKWGAHDANLYDRVLDDHRNKKAPFFTTILSLSSHEPYEVNYVSNDLPRDNWYAYKNSIRYADSCLVDFLDKCKRQPWYDNTLIVLVADHGHDIGLKDKFFFGKEKYHIPLVITGGALDARWKGKAFGQVVSQSIVPSLILGSIGMDTKDFQWQTGVFSPRPFAQYQYNYGFGRVENESSCLSDNLSFSYEFLGVSSDSAAIKNRGKVYQQALIDDFIKK